MSEKTTPTKRKIKWTADKIMSTSALFISFISLLALFYQLNLAKEENYLIRKQQSANVLPYLQFKTIYGVNGFAITITNKGVGPAFIKKVNYTVNDGKHFNNSTATFLHILNHKIEQKEFVNFVGGIPIVENTVIQPGEIINAFEISSKLEKDHIGIANYKNYMIKSPPSFTIIYENIYGEQWELTNNNDKQKFQFITPAKIESNK